MLVSAARAMRRWLTEAGPSRLPSRAAAPTDRMPIFVISYNRGRLLERVVRSYANLSQPTEIVIHDNGSDDEATRDVLTKFERAGTPVVRSGKIRSADELNLVDKTIRRYFKRRGVLAPYIVTDCDIDMSAALPDAIAVYSELLDKFPDVACVGPMLRIRDIPRHYTLYNHVMNRHIEQFWEKLPEWTETSRGPVAFLRAKIDTTFALHRAGAPFHRLKSGIRVYHPYEALHLDWYPDLTDAGDPAYRRSSSVKISTWANEVEFERHGDDRLKYDRFNYVDRDETGALVAKSFRFGEAAGTPAPE